jgi:hypothetical protein
MEDRHLRRSLMVRLCHRIKIMERRVSPEGLQGHMGLLHLSSQVPRHHQAGMDLLLLLNSLGVPRRHLGISQVTLVLDIEVTVPMYEM